jgi:thioredoxin-like negative regulator of GroEL
MMHKLMLWAALPLWLWSPAVLADETPDQLAAAAAAAQRPMLLRFGATWCSACEEMERSSWPRPEVLAAAAPYTMISLDADRDLRWVERYRVQAYPTLILADPEGCSVVEWVGFASSALLQSRLEAANSRWPQWVDWARRSQSDVVDVEATLQLAEAANEFDAIDQAAHLFRQALRESEGGPQQARAQLGWSWVQARRGECKQALRGYRRFKKIGIEDARLTQVETAIGQCQAPR